VIEKAVEFFPTNLGPRLISFSATELLNNELLIVVAFRDKGIVRNLLTEAEIEQTFSLA
jgi:hypothetical protein